MEISAFQKLMKDLYFSSDSQRGIARTSLWLVEELGELMHELKKPESQMKKSAIEEEMADVLAWTSSLANLLQIDLDTAVQKKYPGYCIKCGQNPCTCKKLL